MFLPFEVERGFWPLVQWQVYARSSQSSPRERTAGISSGSITVTNKSNSLTYRGFFSGLHLAVGRHSPLAVVGLHDFVKVSISASLKSFLLIICIDAPESTTNSLSSGLRVDAGKHLFSEGEKNVALSCTFNFNTLLASFHAASRAPCSCHSVSSRDRSSNFGALGLRWWGFTWANISERRIFVSNLSNTRNSLCEFHTLDWLRHVCALTENRLRRRHVLKYATQLSCVRWSTSSRSSFQLVITFLTRSPWSIVTFNKVEKRFPYTFMPITLFQHSYCTFVIILFRPFCRLFINLTMCIRAFFPKPTTTLGLVEQAFWRVPLFTKWVIASSFEVILARPSRHSTTGTLSSGTSGSRWFSLTLLHERIRRRIWWCNFSTLIRIVTETAIVSSRTLSVGFPLPTIS